MTGSRRERLSAQRLYLIAGSPGPVSEWLRPMAAAVAAGIGLVQLRLKRATTGERRAALIAAREALGREVLLIVNDDLAAVWDGRGSLLADGVHLGRDDAAALAVGVSRGLAAARRELGAELLLGTSTRCLAEVDAAVAAGCDHVGFGAMASSSTKADTIRAERTELVRCVAAHPDLPIFPIGGLHAGNLGLVGDTGCRRAALGAGILDAADPHAAALACLDALHDLDR